MILGCLWRAGAVNVSLRGFVCGAGAENVSPRGFVCGAGAENVSPRGLECCVGVLFLSILCWCWGLCGRKFSLLGLLATKTGQNSPSESKTRQIRPFWACRASFIPKMPPRGVCGASFVPERRAPSLRGESFAPIVPPHSVDGGREAGITKPPGTRPGGGGAGDGNRTRL